MTKLSVLPVVLVLLAALAVFAGHEFGPRPALAATSVAAVPFTLCKSTYALCTTATCTPLAGHPGAVSCGCSVRTGYSAATESCKPVQNAAAGQVVVSRYYPVKSFAICSNGRPWANCLDAPCVVDKHDPSKANCTCKIASNQGRYVVVTSSYSKSTCTSGIVSSATVRQSAQITNFLAAEKLLPPFPIKVLHGP